MSRIESAKPAHSCRPPGRTWLAIVRPDAKLGELWRCDTCSKLWRVGRACATCDLYGDHAGGGHCLVGLAWRPATLWQRIKHRKDGRG